MKKPNLFIFTRKMEPTCNYCRRVFSDGDTLRLHKKKCKQKERRYLCAFCPKSFKRYHHRQDHENLHKKKSEFLCSMCGKGYVQKSNLKWHTSHCTNCPVIKLKKKLLEISPDLFDIKFEGLVRSKPPKIENIIPSLFI